MEILYGDDTSCCYKLSKIGNDKYECHPRLIYLWLIITNPMAKCLFVQVKSKENPVVFKCKDADNGVKQYCKGFKTRSLSKLKRDWESFSECIIDEFQDEDCDYIVQLEDNSDNICLIKGNFDSRKVTVYKDDFSKFKDKLFLSVVDKVAKHFYA